MLDEADFERDDAAPIDMLESYFAAHGWEHERLDDEVIAKVKGSWTQYELRALWRDEDSVLQFLAFPDVRVTDERRAAVYEAIGLINEQLWVGHFELWSSSGILLYRHAAIVDGEDGGTLSLGAAELIVESAIDECERFYPVFQFVMWGGKTPKEALAAAMTETQGEGLMPRTLWLVGCGTMAGAMLRQWLATETLDPRDIFVLNRTDRALPDGVRQGRVLPDEPLPDAVMLAMKPQQLDVVAAAWADRLSGMPLLISILAGVEEAALARRFTAGKIVRAMPNLPVGIGKGVVALHSNAGSGVIADAVSQLMAPLGLVEWIDDAGQFDAVTALAGSGPAFLYRFIDALAGAGAASGLPPAQAARLAIATVEGAALQAAAADVSPGILADRVASPGGSTREGLNVLDADNGLRSLLEQTLAAATRRNGEMAAAAR